VIYNGKNANVVMTDGFFDAGMLLQALKARQQQESGSGSEGHGHHHHKRAQRREIGKKLRLSEY
jgi:carnitine O-acetyltransferase